MSTIIAILLWLAMWHFFCEAILAPTIRMTQRNKLFALRDEVRRLHIDRGGKRMDQDLALLHDGINRFLPRLALITPSLARDIAREYEKNSQLHEHAAARQKILDNSAEPRVRDIVKEVDDIFVNAMIANTIGWIIYLIPIAILFVCLSRLKDWANILLTASPRDIDRVMPSGLHV